MVEKSTMYPSNVKQPLVDTRKNNPFPCCIKALDRNGKYEGYNCANRTDPRYYHEWTNAMELTKGGEIQCGRTSNYYCDHRTFYGITGYRNTCPIAGCSGTYFQPAILQLELSQAHLANYGIINGTEIHSIALNFSHRSLGVNVANTTTSDSWGPNFCGFDKYPDLKVLKMYITDKNGVQKGNIVIHNENPPLKGFSGISAIFTGITYNDIVDGYINIEYQRNLSTTPGNIYIRDLSITAEYTNAYPYMTGTSDFTELYISEQEECKTTGELIIDVGYQNINGKIPLSQSPKDLRQDVQIMVPETCSYTKKNIDEHRIRIKYKDDSDITGVKYIACHLKNHLDKLLIFDYTAKKREQPIVKILSQYTKNSYYQSNSIVVSGKDVCINKIDFYTNGFDTTPILTLNNNYINVNNSQNIITDEGIELFHNTITNLNCGKYKLFIKINDSAYYYGGLSFTVVNPIYTFKITELTSTTDTYRFNFGQDKFDDKKILLIQRTDNIKTVQTPEFTISTDSNYKNIENTLDTINKGKQIGISTFEPTEMKTFDVSIKYPGLYNLTIEETSDFIGSCNHTLDKRLIDIKPNHKQYHDTLFVRGEDSTSFKYDYLVAWEGDNIEEPIYVSDIDIGASFNDIKICVEKPSFKTGLSQIGVAKIKVTNQSKKTLKNIRIELNVLTTDENGNDVVTLDEFFNPDGIFLYLKDNFYEYNKSNASNLSILNLPNSIDDDNIGEENVEILIKTLEYDDIDKEGDSIEIQIPYMSRTDKIITIQPLIFEQPIPLYTYNNCSLKSFPIDNFKLIVYDSILTDLTIEGNTDLLEINSEFAECPNQCFTTDLTYKITNIDSSETEKILSKTKITNDVNLVPYKFVYKQNNVLVTKTADEIANQNPLSDNIKVQWNYEEKTRQQMLSNEVVTAHIHFPNHEKYNIQSRTDINGQTTFYFDIPNSISESYTLKKLLKQAVTFTYQGNLEHQNSTLYIDSNNNLINTVDENNNKNQVFINYESNYKRYKAGETVEITLFLTYLQKYNDNSITFYPIIQKIGDTDYIQVFYKICNLYQENNDKEIYNQGVLNTTFETDDYQLIENKVNKTIYAGMDTNLQAKVNIAKRLIEQEELNIINIQLDNKDKDNKEVSCEIDLSPKINDNSESNNCNYIGQYTITDISIDNGNIIIDEETPTIEWLVGEMNANSVTNAQIILKGKDIGLSEICITPYDYLHKKNNNKDYKFGLSRCCE